MKCTNPETSNGKKCDGELTAFDFLPSGKVECNKCGFRTDEKVEAPKKAKKETEIKEIE